MPLGASLVVLLTAIAATPAHHPVPAHVVPAVRCATPEYHQFDFALGDWDTYDMEAPTTLIARNHVSRMLDGCAVREVYDQNDGLQGESISTYDASRHRWHQSWFTNHGTLLLFDAHLEGTRMVFTAPERQANGTATTMRVFWWPEGRNVRERAERSQDAGKTWIPLFDIVFRPHDSRNGK